MGGRSAVFLFVLVFSCLVPPPLCPPLLVVGGGGVRLPRSLRIELETASFFLPRQEQSSMRMNRTTELSGDNRSTDDPSLERGSSRHALLRKQMMSSVVCGPEV